MTGANNFSVSGYGPERGGMSRLLARDSLARRLDWPILLSAVALSLIGSALVYSATRNRTEINQGDPYYFLIRHLMNTGIGIALMIGTVWLGHRTLRTAVPILYGLSVFMILLVLTPLGATINGQRNWLVAGGLSLQPAEFTKITIILGMAMLLATRVDAGDKQYPDHRTVLQALGLAAVPMMIVMLMPDLGTIMVAVIIVLGVLLASGASNRWVFGLLGAGALGAVAIWQLKILDEYQINRFAAFANPDLDPAACRLQHQPGADRHRLRRPLRHRPGARLPDDRPVRPRTADGLRLHGRGRGTGLRGRSASSCSCSASSCGGPAASPARPPSCTARSSPPASSPGSPSRPSRTSA